MTTVTEISHPGKIFTAVYSQEETISGNTVCILNIRKFPHAIMGKNLQIHIYCYTSLLVILFQAKLEL